MVHFKRVCGCEKAQLFEARIFEEGSYENRDKWAGGFNVHIQGTEASISLLDRGWSRKANERLEEFCKGKGVRRLRWERRGRKMERKI